MEPVFGTGGGRASVLRFVGRRDIDPGGMWRSDAVTPPDTGHAPALRSWRAALGQAPALRSPSVAGDAERELWSLGSRGPGERRGERGRAPLARLAIPRRPPVRTAPLNFVFTGCEHPIDGPPPHPHRWWGTRCWMGDRIRGVLPPNRRVPPGGGGSVLLRGEGIDPRPPRADAVSGAHLRRVDPATPSRRLRPPPSVYRDAVPCHAPPVTP